MALQQLANTLASNDPEALSALQLLQRKAMQQRPAPSALEVVSGDEQMPDFSDAEEDFVAEGVTREQFEKIRTRLAAKK